MAKAKPVVSKSVQRRLAIQKAGKKPAKAVKTVKKPVKKVEPIESEQEVEFDDTEYDGHDDVDFGEAADLDERDTF